MDGGRHSPAPGAFGGFEDHQWQVVSCDHSWWRCPFGCFLIFCWKAVGPHWKAFFGMMFSLFLGSGLSKSKFWSKGAALRAAVFECFSAAESASLRCGRLCLDWSQGLEVVNRRLGLMGWCLRAQSGAAGHVASQRLGALSHFPKPFWERLASWQLIIVFFKGLRPPTRFN